jgi:hypothetical protein
MKILGSIAVASLALALSTGAFAQGNNNQPATGPTSAVTTTPEMVNSGKMDDTGMKTLGIDISQGSAGMAADAQASAKANCKVVVDNKDNANAKVLKFCQDLLGS